MKNNKFCNLMIVVGTFILAGCGFHLRGADGDYQFPYKTVYLDCSVDAICSDFKKTIKNQNLATIIPNRESAEAIITISDERSNSEFSNFNSVGQISGLKLTYEVTARVYAQNGMQSIPDIVARSSQTINYNNSLILSATQEEQSALTELHTNVIDIIIRRIVYSKPLMASMNVESK